MEGGDEVDQMEEGAAEVLATASPVEKARHEREKPDLDDLDPKQRRKEANKESARKSREKKKVEIDQVMVDNINLKRQVELLEYQLALAEGRPPPPLPALLREEADAVGEEEDEEAKKPIKKQRRPRAEKE
jgi:hypothetical protein